MKVGAADAREHRGLAHDRQHLLDRHDRAGLLQRARERALGLGEHVVEIDRFQIAAAAPDAREREQVVDQDLHPLRAVDREVDVLVGALVELAVVAALECLTEARDLAQRLLQIV